MTNDTTTRVIEWVAPGYEGAFTQYTVTPDGMMYCSQVATRENMARALQPARQFSQRFDTVDIALYAVDMLITNRTEDGTCVELDADGKRIS